MPVTDPTFQHSDEDWTQITQPRLRKRVQNRVSQRKHRSKVRQQRANSVDAAQALSAPMKSHDQWPSHRSHDVSVVGDHQYHRKSSISPQQQQAQTALFQQNTGLETFHDYNDLGVPDCAIAQSPYVGNLPMTDPPVSTYPAASPEVMSEYPLTSYTYGDIPSGGAQRPSMSSSAYSSAYGLGPNGADTSEYDLSKPWYQVPDATSMLPSSFLAGSSSAVPSSTEYARHTTYPSSWQPQSLDYPAGAASLNTPKPTRFNDYRYYSSDAVAPVDGRSGVTDIAGPAYSTTETSRAYSSSGSTPFQENLEPRESGYTSSYYRHGKHDASGSRSKKSHPPRYR
ncbi:MAG: hypothetical protein Q9207_007198 [Kuettlingeria erythrocarpa]